ncbi:NAD/NADP octopine/nopaline dehydrogenase family protein [Butyricicoccus faecihominis]|uniref:NAD/NADP-dependent octopine/nopaline dehydrogenase family protein n=1 Tax=Butyricicoccaceae TaxID=3085642 RepID=UPI00247B103A|nr:MULTISPECIES: NAD/NADP-dependent octopine/nopaline dehydrogenase family protein [Butyricicoccaceae]MCQ5131164.1 NAD/NADP octopine/nopaline dehydrogenase family protein [Butyricicoccus faecihominis]WNX84340.1 NAD/NADP octopine/nopaline dehydrogenase family protein [Agathobaculum sp. NTUH-O15-33]
MDMSYLKDKPIAILGAGGVGKTMAGDCALAGKEVRMWDQPAFAKRNFVNIEKTGITLAGHQFSFFGFKRTGTAKVALATDDMAKAVKGAGIIIVATVAVAHESIFRELIPLLEDGQVIHILPDNCGTFIFRKLMREMNCTAKVIVGAWYTAPYGVRIVNRGGVTTNECKVEDRITTIRGCALPMSDNDAFMASAFYIPAFDAIIDAEGEVTISKKGEEFHHGFVVGNTVLDINLSNVNPVIHVPGALLAVSTMQNFDTVLGQDKKKYSLYAFGACPAIAEVQARFWEEEKALAAKMEVGLCTVNYEDFFSRTTMYGKEYMGPDFAVPYEENYENFWGDGPFDLENRYITEDVPVGCYLMSQLGKKYDVATPIIDAMILLASTMIKRDLIKDSKYTLDYLEIGHMTHEQLQKYLREGVYTAK